LLARVAVIVLFLYNGYSHNRFIMRKRFPILLVWPVLVAAALILSAPEVRADHTTVINYVEDSVVTVGGIDLSIVAGSVQEGLEVDNGSLTVTVPAGEAFFLRSPGPFPLALENDGGLAVCDVIGTRDNQMVLQGPRTVTVTPSVAACDTTGYDTDTTPIVTLDQPAAGAILEAGQSVQLFWQTGGIGANAIRIRLSTDNGATYETGVVSGIMNNGFYQWTVPEVYTTSEALLKIEGMNGQGDILAVDVSPMFTIEGEDPPLPPAPEPEPTWGFDPEAITLEYSSIDSNMGWVAPAEGEVVCQAGFRIKTAESSAVYYCGADGKRHAFPNLAIHATWFGEDGNWGGVVEVSAETLASIPLGANMTYRPGVRMVKITTDPKTYVVAPGNVLRWVPTEAAAIALYGANWNQQIDDLPDAFFTDYTIGEPLELK
jgi:hypothetical protein